MALHANSRNTKLCELLTRTTLSVKQAPMSVTQNITRPSSVKAWLAGELESRCQRNPKYSLRAFARDLAISAPRLSRVLSGTEGISRSAATSLEAPGFVKEETTHLCYLAESQFAPTASGGRAKLIELRAGADSNLQLDAFKIVSDWYHFALLELTLTTGFQNDPDWMARQLGISIHEVRGALERLKRLDALTETEGHFCANRDFVVNAAGIPSEAVRKFHGQILKNAEQALVFQGVEEREITSLVLAVDSREIPDAKLMIRKFRDEFGRTFSGNQTRKNQVYAFSIQFFSLQKPSNLKSKEKTK